MRAAKVALTLLFITLIGIAGHYIHMWQNRGRGERVGAGDRLCLRGGAVTQDFHSPFTAIKSAHKRHQCTWCGEEIPVGTAYEKAAAVFEGDFAILKKHPECRVAFDAWALAADRGDTYDPGDMRRGSPCEPWGDPCDDCTCGRLAEKENEDE